MRVLLTGAGGFVGHHTLAHLLKTTDWTVVATDSFRHAGISARLREVRDELPKEFSQRVKVVTHDLRAPIDPITADELGSPNVIINMASESHVDRSLIDPRPFVENNIALALTVLEYARSLDDLRCFIQVSTDEVYGPAKPGQYHAEYDEIIPSNPYSASKAGQEALATAYWRSFGLPMIITNTMNIFGERQDPEKFVPKTVRALLNNERMTVHARTVEGQIVSGSRFYLHARNQADILRFLIDRFSTTPHRYADGLSRPERFNVVGDVEVSNDDLVRTIAKIMGVNEDCVDYLDVADSRPGHDLRYALDGGKLRDLGWTPPVPFIQSLERTVVWTANNPRWVL